MNLSKVLFFLFLCAFGLNQNVKAREGQCQHVPDPGGSRCQPGFHGDCQLCDGQLLCNCIKN